MLNRDYKTSYLGGHYHVYNRGNEKRDIFRNSDDYRFFLFRLQQNLKPTGCEGRFFRPLPENSFTLISYCLMPNHFHLQIRQNKELPPGVLLQKICTSYSMYFNKKYERVGHVFQDQFKQIVVDDDRYFLWLSAYIHLNPIQAGISKNIENYPWSSAGQYIGRSGGFCDTSVVLDRFGENANQKYQEYLGEAFLAENKEVSDRWLL